MRSNAEAFPDSQLCSSAPFHPVRLIADDFVRSRTSLDESVQDVWRKKMFPFAVVLPLLWRSGLICAK